MAITKEELEAKQKAAEAAYKRKIDNINDAVDAGTEATGDPVTGFIVKFFIIMALGAISPPLVVPAVIVALIL